MPPVPKAIRVRTSDGWQDVALRGPPGLTQVWTGPDAPAPRGDYVAWIDTDEASGDLADRVAANESKIGLLQYGRLLDVQRIVGLGPAGTRGIANGGQMYLNDAGTVPMRLTYTPPVACWWEVYMHNSHFAKTTAEYTYGYMQMALSPVDADGVFSIYDLVTQHSQVQQYEPRNGHALFKLNAGVAYTANVMFYTNGGGWNQNTHPNECLMWSKAYAR